MRLLSLILTLSLSLPLGAGSQGGQDIPDAIAITNSSLDIIQVEGTALYNGQTYTFDTKNKGSFVIKQGKNKYTVTYPCYKQGSPITDSHYTVSLDFTTLAWLAHNSKQPQSIDEIEIENDMLYNLLIRYHLTKAHSLISIPHKVKPHDTSSKIVRDETGAQSPGTVEITDEQNKKYLITIARRSILKKAPPSDWKTVKLCANTIVHFHKGFQVTLN